MLLFSTLSHLADLIDVTNSMYEAKIPLISERLLKIGWLDMMHGQAREGLPFASSACATLAVLAQANQGESTAYSYPRLIEWLTLPLPLAWGRSDLCREVTTRFQRILVRTLKRLFDSPAMVSYDFCSHPWTSR